MQIACTGYLAAYSCLLRRASLNFDQKSRRAFQRAAFALTLLSSTTTTAFCAGRCQGELGEMAPERRYLCRVW
jgi:hypothetical protein